MTDPLKESQEFVSFDLQRGMDDDTVLVNPTGAEPAEVPSFASIEQVGGQPLAYAMTSPATDAQEAYLYFWNRPITKQTTVNEFGAGGGVEVDVTPAGNQSIDQVIESAGPRGVRVEIGPYHGVVIWADPTSDDDLRLHHVYWQAGDHLFALLVDASPEKAVSAAREVACGMSA